jgi:hypothetical protein
MQATCERPKKTLGRGWLIWPFLLLLGYLLFAHGCHGDEDNELFGSTRAVGQAF